MYCEVNDIESEFNSQELARLTGDSSGVAIDYTKINLSISRASAIIEAYLSKRFTIPIDNVANPIIKHICIALAISDLFEMRYKFSSIPESILSKKRAAFNLLKMLKTGDISLNGANHGTSASPFIFSNKSEENILFNSEVLGDFFGGKFE